VRKNYVRGTGNTDPLGLQQNRKEAQRTNVDLGTKKDLVIVTGPDNPGDDRHKRTAQRLKGRNFNDLDPKTGLGKNYEPPEKKKFKLVVEVHSGKDGLVFGRGEIDPATGKPKKRYVTADDTSLLSGPVNDCKSKPQYIIIHGCNIPDDVGAAIAKATEIDVILPPKSEVPGIQGTTMVIPGGSKWRLFKRGKMTELDDLNALLDGPK
jgi:hypothetical protein